MPWLISIARRAAFDLLRTRRRRVALFEKNTDSEPSFVASLSDDRREIQHHLDELPHLQKQIIHLSFFKKLPLRDIAPQFGISTIQARTIRRKALNSLKEKLKLENL
jgi:RNA polymerase sigma factor (sigma-70 family)